MKKISSFCVDHTKLEKGMYLSRIDGDIKTYDIRMCKPNGGDYLDNPGMHTFEHLFATYARNSAFADEVIYVGPMGCRTGFYLLVRDLDEADAIRLVQDAMAFIASYEGEIPGNTVVECGNFLEHDLASAKKMGARMAKVLENWTPDRLQYA
ncbi:S-ribosylhomocysteine lyase [Candidatus Soleaferrea massiliensis]|uniref:S-ribosylhomocysteine lyase n=1 Tax=Candidatus Soleaferrea massiliensis TaxID=1470354 RepID=UPI00058F3834|nr:S-ribosylhomocysteine lyase [Candidatus Soleaferrea massiliensis]